MKNAAFVALMLTVAIAGCAPPTAQTSPELAAGADRWEELYNAGDLEALAELYAADARLLPPNSERVEGHDSVIAAFQEMSDAGLSIALDTVEAMAAGDLGYRIGTYELTTPDGSLADRGKYIEVWRQIDGEWKITNDIYNSDLAAGPQGRLVFGMHEVGDPAVWLAAWQDDQTRRQQFAANGIAGVRVFKDPDSETTTGLLLDVVDPEAFQAFLESPEGVEAAAADTVKMDTLRLLTAVE